MCNIDTNNTYLSSIC